MHSAFLRSVTLVLVLLVACTPSRRDDGDDGSGNTGGNGTAKCGNGVLEPGETCDSAIADGPGACPASCAPGDACTPVVLTGSAAACTAACTPLPVSTCRSGDGCCAPGCNSTTDADCSATCGNGVLDGNETCDGNCPTSCNDGDRCTQDTLVGSPATCNVSCRHASITVCQSGDGCCPGGCTNATDSDCAPANLCGNGRIDANETCDGNCPASCDDLDSCTTDTRQGSPATCNVTCVNTPVSCRNGDGCCPSGCTHANDSDCQGAVCGNGIVESGEICDLNCPSSCDDGDACTTDSKSGSSSMCNVTCSHRAVTSCVNNDGCCPGGCTSSNDNDCSSGATCPNGCPSGQACVNGFCATLPIGAACTNTSGCTGGVCNSQEETGWPGGYCSDSCSSSTDCPSGSACINGGCFKKCFSNSDCRSGYQCYARFSGSTTTICAPVGTTNASVGSPCNTVTDCGGGQRALCLTQASDGAKGGYCSYRCDASNPCPGSSHCTSKDSNGVGYCLQNCPTPSCRGAGYGCYDKDNDGVKECWISATGTGQPGAPCSGIWDCAGGLDGECMTVDLTNGLPLPGGGGTGEWPGGYCMTTCTAPGDCPSGAVCDYRNGLDSWLGGQKYCLDGCSSSAECRTGYTCRVYDAVLTAGTIYACRP